MSNNDLKIMMAAFLPLDEPMRPRKNIKTKRRGLEEKPWELNEKAKKRYVERLNRHWAGENDA